MFRTDVFKQFTERNKKVFADMGANPSAMTFTTTAGDGSEQFKHARLLDKLAASRTFPASVEPGNTLKVDAVARQAGGDRVTREAIEKKMRASILVPVLVAATLYLILSLLL
ncbi:MAG: hypothetical protein JW839_19210 [Candidatus Lokiarchaeota archaeon]|nr:hypothetical protein [Candidatus Lokiarchaeota archaeon]